MDLIATLGMTVVAVLIVLSVLLVTLLFLAIHFRKQLRVFFVDCLDWSSHSSSQRHGHVRINSSVETRYYNDFSSAGTHEEQKAEPNETTSDWSDKWSAKVHPCNDFTSRIIKQIFTKQEANKSQYKHVNKAGCDGFGLNMYNQLDHLESLPGSFEESAAECVELKEIVVVPTVLAVNIKDTDLSRGYYIGNYAPPTHDQYDVHKQNENTLTLDTSSVSLDGVEFINTAVHKLAQQQQTQTQTQQHLAQNDAVEEIFGVSQAFAHHQEQSSLGNQCVCVSVYRDIDSALSGGQVYNPMQAHGEDRSDSSSVVSSLETTSVVSEDSTCAADGHSSAGHAAPPHTAQQTSRQRTHGEDNERKTGHQRTGRGGKFSPRRSPCHATKKFARTPVQYQPEGLSIAVLDAAQTAPHAEHVPEGFESAGSPLFSPSRRFTSSILSAKKGGSSYDATVNSALRILSPDVRGNTGNRKANKTADLHSPHRAGGWKSSSGVLDRDVVRPPLNSPTFVHFAYKGLVQKEVLQTRLRASSDLTAQDNTTEDSIGNKGQKTLSQRERSSSIADDLRKSGALYERYFAAASNDNI